MTIESDGRTEPHVETESASAADDASDAATDGQAPSLPFYNRTPWKYGFPMLIIALIWIAIGLVCSPTDFRF